MEEAVAVCLLTYLARLAPAPTAAVRAVLYRQEIHRVEEQIKRRVAIGSFVSERKLVDELVRWVEARWKLGK
jgi:hypothetical protein